MGSSAPPGNDERVGSTVSHDAPASVGSSASQFGSVGISASPGDTDAMDIGAVVSALQGKDIKYFPEDTAFCSGAGTTATSSGGRQGTCG